MTNKHPNILIFNPDQWRGDMLGYLGYPGAKTPNLDNIVNNDGNIYNFNMKYFTVQWNFDD